MQVRRPAAALCLLSCLSLCGCLVSFEDYPLGALGRGGASMGTSGSDFGGSASSAGSASGGDANGGTTSGGGETGGTATGGDNMGGSSAGGSGGSGGSMVLPDELLLDDFEDGDAQILPVAGRNGAWFVTNDGSGQQTPAAGGPALPSVLMPPRGASLRAMHTTGTGFNTWGATIGASFVVNGTMPVAYDISSHQGVSFLIRSGKTTAVKQVRVSIRDYDTLIGCTVCGDHFGATVNYGDTFQTVQVPFSTLKQQMWGRPQVPTFDAKRTYAISFSWTQHQTFDVWIDDICFY